MFKPEQLLPYSLGLMILLVVGYLIWPYLVAFLAIVGAFQIYHVWRRHRR